MFREEGRERSKEKTEEERCERHRRNKGLKCRPSSRKLALKGGKVPGKKKVRREGEGRRGKLLARGSYRSRLAWKKGNSMEPHK